MDAQLFEGWKTFWGKQNLVSEPTRDREREREVEGVEVDGVPPSTSATATLCMLKIVHEIDYRNRNSAVISLMEALNASDVTVIKYWEDKIVDSVNHVLWTNNWEANRVTDMKH